MKYLEHADRIASNIIYRCHNVVNKVCTKIGLILFFKDKRSYLSTGICVNPSDTYIYGSVFSLGTTIKYNLKNNFSTTEVDLFGSTSCY